VRTRVGYAGGTLDAPTYHRLGDHAETIEIDYDPSAVSYDDLLGVFFSSHSPTRPAYSTQYRSAVFYRDDEERLAAERAIERLRDTVGAVHTAVEPFTRFWRAEDYHQKYRLRRYRDLTAEFHAMYPVDRDFVDSTAAARVNGWLDGCGARSVVERDLPRTGLSRGAQDEVRATVFPRERATRV
jgi:peptide-methionine (S)-S-oxide reductase